MITRMQRLTIVIPVLLAFAAGAALATRLPSAEAQQAPRGLGLQACVQSLAHRGAQLQASRRSERAATKLVELANAARDAAEQDREKVQVLLDRERAHMRRLEEIIREHLVSRTLSRTR